MKTNMALFYRQINSRWVVVLLFLLLMAGALLLGLLWTLTPPPPAHADFPISAPGSAVAPNQAEPTLLDLTTVPATVANIGPLAWDGT